MHPPVLVLALTLLSIARTLSAQNVAPRDFLSPCTIGYLFFGNPDLSPASLPGAERRAEFAKLLLEPMQELYAAIPNLSPDEDKWLDEELRSGGLQRHTLAMDSLAGHKRLTKNTAAGIIRNLNLLLRPDPLPLKQQIGIWAVLAKDYGDCTNFVIAVVRLADAGIIDPRYAPKRLEKVFPIRGQGAEMICQMRGTEILTGIVIPYLMSDGK